MLTLQFGLSVTRTSPLQGMEAWVLDFFIGVFFFVLVYLHKDQTDSKFPYRFNKTVDSVIVLVLVDGNDF